MPYIEPYSIPLLYNNQYYPILISFLYGLETPTSVYSVSGLSQPLFCFLLDMPFWKRWIGAMTLICNTDFQEKSKVKRMIKFTIHTRVSNVRAVTNPAPMHHSDKYRVKTKTRLNTKSIFIRISELAPYSAILTRSFCLAALQAPEGSPVGTF